VSPRNRKRKEAAYARNYGDEADAVRAMPCLCRGHGALVRCSGDIVDAHVKTRGSGGGRFDVVPLCDGHHTEQHRIGIRTFAARYGLDLRAEADRIAIAHSEPLGIRGLARRWPAELSVRFDLVVLGDYERGALLGWVGRAMRARHDGYVAARVRGGASPDGPGVSATMDPVSRDIAVALGFTSNPFELQHGTCVWSLCEAAGWPS
jgi:hypothetical protein